MKKPILLASLTTMSLFVTACIAQASSYSDTSGHIYEEAIEYISEKNIVEGYEDGSFRADNTINRAELLKIIMETNQKNPEALTKCFDDIADEWFAKYVCTAKKLGIIKGYSDNTFRPGNKVNFVEALKIIQLSYGAKIVEGTPWFEGYIDEARSKNMIPNTISDYPQNITRGEMADIMTRYLKLEEGTQESYLNKNSLEKNPPQASNEKPDNLRYFEAFKEQSIFYKKIPENAIPDEESDTMVESLIDQAEQAFLIAVKEWSVPVYYANASTAKHDVLMTEDWAPKEKMLGIPIPDYAEADPEEDAHMVIIDESAGCIYDFWSMKKNNGSWQAGWGNALPLDSNGIFPTGLSARGSGFELLQGLIWPQELERGSIDHALIFSYDHTKSGGPVSPATESDGTSDDDWAIPEGALVQLDPTLDLNTLGLNDYEMTIAKALQEYGMYTADDGGGLSLYAINPRSVKSNSYENIWGDETYIFLDKIPVEKFRVLELPQQNDSEASLSENRCARYE